MVAKQNQGQNIQADSIEEEQKRENPKMNKSMKRNEMKKKG